MSKQDFFFKNNIKKWSIVYDNGSPLFKILYVPKSSEKCSIRHYVIEIYYYVTEIYFYISRRDRKTLPHSYRMINSNIYDFLRFIKTFTYESKLLTNINYNNLIKIISNNFLLLVSTFNR